jgi:predicted transcriptional regulator
MSFGPEKKPGRRISKQLCRAAAIMEVLHRHDEPTVKSIADIVSPLFPFPVCERTIRRDLEALLAIGFVERKTMTRRYASDYYVWSLATPVMLLEGLKIADRRRELWRIKNDA